MGSFFDIIKRVGAVVIVLVLIVMMGLIFSSQPIDEITSTIMGNLSAGSFSGENISQQEYSIYASNCRQKAGKNLGPESKTYIEYCINNSMKQTFSLASLGRHLGLESNIELAKRDLWDDANQEYENQSGIAEEDKLSVNEIYRFSISNYPLDVRLRQDIASETYNMLKTPLPNVIGNKRWESALDSVTIELRLISYNDWTIMQAQMKATKVTDDEILAEFQKNQLGLRRKKNDKSLSQAISQIKKKPTEAQKQRISQQLKFQKAQAAKERIKAQLDNLSALSYQKKIKAGLNLDKIAKISKLSIVSLGKIAFSDLESIQVEQSKINLANIQFLKGIKGNTNKAVLIGPIKNGPNNVYAEISKLKVSKNTHLKGLLSKKKSIASGKKAIKTSYQKTDDNNLSRKYLFYIIEEESKRGDFKVNHPK